MTAAKAAADRRSNDTVGRARLAEMAAGLGTADRARIARAFLSNRKAPPISADGDGRAQQTLWPHLWTASILSLSWS
jgi:hypothetical protein